MVHVDRKQIIAPFERVIKEELKLKCMFSFEIGHPKLKPSKDSKMYGTTQAVTRTHHAYKQCQLSPAGQALLWTSKVGIWERGHLHIRDVTTELVI